MYRFCNIVLFSRDKIASTIVFFTNVLLAFYSFFLFVPLGRLNLCLQTNNSLSFRRCWRFVQKTRYSMRFCNKSCGLSRIIRSHIEIETGRKISRFSILERRPEHFS